MELDQEYFDSVNMDVVKRKYYEADKVNAVLGEIRRRAESTNRENAQLRGELDAFRGQKAEIGDMLLTARSLARSIIENANAQADEIVARARTQADAILREAEEKADALAESYPDQQEQAAKCVERAIDGLKQRHLDAIEELNGVWQDFLISLAQPGEPEESAPDAEEPAVPADLERKVGAIARELRAMEEEA